MLDSLLKPISRLEVKESIFFMDPYKAPGPDGFQHIFYQTFWDLVRNDVWELVA